MNPEDLCGLCSLPAAELSHRSGGSQESERYLIDGMLSYDTSGLIAIGGRGRLPAAKYRS
jgi:hypothetical protein